jgi:hypothetical protein
MTLFEPLFFTAHRNLDRISQLKIAIVIFLLKPARSVCTRV